MRFRIDNLPNHTTEHDIRQLFSGYGNVLSVTLHPGLFRGNKFGTGLIELEEINIQDIGAFPDRCLFRGTVLHITQLRGSTETKSREDPAALGDPNEPAPRQPDNRSKNMLHVTSVEEVLHPATGKPNGWCRYSINSVAGSITGQRHGSVAEVTLYAEEAAESFNLRNMLGPKGSPVWSSRHKK
jgi:hypothetical protein